MKENARQGYWNGALPPLGYRIVAAEQRGAKIKKKLEIDPIHAETVRLFYRLALKGEGDSGPMGIKSITNRLNARNIRTRDGGKFGIASVHQILTRTTYIGQHRFNTRDHKTRSAKPQAEHAVMEVPPIVTEAEFEGAQSAMDAAPRGQRPNLAHWNMLLRIMRRGHDAADSQRQPVSLLHLLNQGSSGQIGLQRADRADG
jgi:site-specific DNA recombinase